tara:strand:+ start:468 stop:731 length:264 start_codon:yes stop_codon:yes gene_type:complete
MLSLIHDSSSELYLFLYSLYLFNHKSTYYAFTKENFEFSAQASAVSITVGKNAQISTTRTSAGASADSDKNKQQGFYQNDMDTFYLS